MYRTIEGYEEAMSLSCDVIDEVKDLVHDLRYGKPYSEIMDQLHTIEKMVSKVKSSIEEGKGEKIQD